MVNWQATPSYVYAIGRVEARFPNLAAEKEFAQATGRADTAGKTDQQTFHAVLSQRENRYLVRQLCWVLTIQGLETYLLVPRDPADIDLLVEAIRPAPAPNDIDVVIGMRGPIAPPEMCNGLMVPIVAFDQIYSFDRDALIKAIPKPEKMTDEQFGPAAEELFNRIMQMTDNAGATDEHRALNYLAMRYPAIYAKAAEEFAENFSLTGVEVRPSPLEQRAQHRRCHLLLHQPQYRFHGEVLCARRCDRGVSVPGHQDVAVLRTLNLPNERRCEMNMNIPGFTAESSVYRRSRFYQHSADFSNLNNNLIPQSCFDDCIDNDCQGRTGRDLLNCRGNCTSRCSGSNVTGSGCVLNFKK